MAERNRKLENNKKNAMAMYKTAFEGRPAEAVTKYLAENYREHNPQAVDGPEGLIDYFERMQKEYPNKKIEFVRCIAEGDLVALHTHQVWPDNEEYVTMDFFRFDENGKICEHWDAIQQVPKEALNPNKMY